MPAQRDILIALLKKTREGPTDYEALYAGTGEGYFREEVRGTWLPLRGEGVYKTTDGGARMV